MLNCEAFHRFQVLRFPFEFQGDPESAVKLWVVARNVPDAEVVICFKPTSQTARYEREPSLLAGAVEYPAGQLPIFAKRTFIDPKEYPVPYAHLRACYLRGSLEVVGELPGDFREKMIAAVAGKREWRKQQKEYFLGWFL